MPDSDRPKIRVYIPGAAEPVYRMPACCEDPTPGVEPRVFAGDTTHQNLYCENCDTDWMEFRWRTDDVANLLQETTP